VKIGPVDPEIIFKERNEWLYTFAILKLRSYWHNVHQSYTQCSQIIADKHLKNQNGGIPSRFGMPRRHMKMIRPILSIFTQNCVLMYDFDNKCPLSYWEKRFRSLIYDQMPTMWWKFGENRIQWILG